MFPTTWARRGRAPCASSRERRQPATHPVTGLGRIWTQPSTEGRGSGPLKTQEGVRGESPGPGTRPTRLLVQLRRLEPGHPTPPPSSPFAVLLFLAQVQGQRCWSSQPWTLNLEYSNQRGRGTPLASCAQGSVRLGPAAQSLVKGHAGPCSGHRRRARECPRSRRRDGGRPLLPAAPPPRPPDGRPLKVGVGTPCQECTLNTRLWKEASGPWFCGGRRVEPRTISAACPHGPGTGTGPPVFWGAGSVVGKSARLLRTSCVPSDKLLSLSEPESPNRPRVPGGLTGRSAADCPPAPWGTMATLLGHPGT